jgi:hypothetical protein
VLWKDKEGKEQEQVDEMEGGKDGVKKKSEG